MGGTKMAEHHTTAPAELGAPMDYAEHEKTYAGFAGLVKWATVTLVALMIAMAFGFLLVVSSPRPFFSF